MYGQSWKRATYIRMRRRRSPTHPMQLEYISTLSLAELAVACARVKMGLTRPARAATQLGTSHQKFDPDCTRGRTHVSFAPVHNLHNLLHSTQPRYHLSTPRNAPQAFRENSANRASCDGGGGEGSVWLDADVAREKRGAPSTWMPSMSQACPLTIYKPTV